jgi:hyperosmotically inducible periplasmic protein
MVAAQHCHRTDTMNSYRIRLSALAGALIASLALGACGRHEINVNTPRAAAPTEEQRSAEAAQKATDQAVVATHDATITTTITAELARDAALDPNKIDVDTSQGRVVLRGSAPDEDAKERAKQIALAVNGVRGVDNYLSVNGKT